MLQECWDAGSCGIPWSSCSLTQKVKLEMVDIKCSHLQSNHQSLGSLHTETHLLKDETTVTQRLQRPHPGFGSWLGSVRTINHDRWQQVSATFTVQWLEIRFRLYQVNLKSTLYLHLDECISFHVIKNTPCAFYPWSATYELCDARMCDTQPLYTLVSSLTKGESW